MEPILLKNCTRVIGLARGKLTVIPVESVLVNEYSEVHYNTSLKSGYVIDCERGVIVQAAYNGFLTLARRTFSEPVIDNTVDEKRKKSSTALEHVVLWHILAGSTGFSIEGGCEDFENSVDELKQLFEHIKFICLREVRAGGEPLADKQSKSARPLCMLISDIDILSGEYTSVLSKLGERTTENAKSIVYVLTGIDRRLVLRFMSERRSTPLSTLLTWLTSHSPQVTVVIVTHGWISARDLELIANMEKVYLVHCPYTSMSSGYGGFFPLKEMLSRMPQRLVIGTCVPGNETPFTSMMDFLVLEKLLTSYNYWSPTPTVEDIAFMLYNGWKIVDELKSCIEPGCKPDLVVYKKASSHENLSSSMLFSLKRLVPSWIVSDRGPLKVESLLENLNHSEESRRKKST